MAVLTQTARVQRDQRYETPMYGVSEAELYLRVPVMTLGYWLTGKGNVPPIIDLASKEPKRLSFMNLLECHMLSAMRSLYRLRLPKIRSALRSLSTGDYARRLPHPLVQIRFLTDGVNLLIHEMDRLVDLSRHGQLAIPQVMEAYLQRIEVDQEGLLQFYPFVMSKRPDEPKFIVISPRISFGKPVVAGTGISTAVIASRFNARESVTDLAREYGLEERQIEEAIRWETRAAA